MYLWFFISLGSWRTNWGSDWRPSCVFGLFQLHILLLQNVDAELKQNLCGLHSCILVCRWPSRSNGQGFLQRISSQLLITLNPDVPHLLRSILLMFFCFVVVVFLFFVFFFSMLNFSKYTSLSSISTKRHNRNQRKPVSRLFICHTSHILSYWCFRWEN